MADRTAIEWPAHLAALAEKASGERLPASRGSSPHAEFIAACWPERVRVLCELARIASILDVIRLRGDRGSNEWHATLDGLRNALAAVEALEKEEK